MAKTTEVTYYTLAELIEKQKEGKVSSTAVERAKQWLRECATDYEWGTYTYEEWEKILAEIGFENAKINFSGFASQGDGASFTANLDIAKLITFLSTPIEPKESVDADSEGNEVYLNYVVGKLHARYGGKVTNPRYGWLEWIVNNLSGGVKRICRRYSHSNTCRAEVELDSCRERPLIEALVDEFQKDIEELRGELSQLIYRDLEAEHDYRTKDETIIEESTEREILFDGNGRPE